MQYDKHGMENVRVLFAKIYTSNNYNQGTYSH
jgi:hypothetical protein